MEEQNSIKIVCISDTHNKAAGIKLPKGDVLIHAGDFSKSGHPQEVSQFNDFLKQSPFQLKIVIAGNHEKTFDIISYLKESQNLQESERFDPYKTKALLTDCVYLEDQSYDLLGYKVYGSPYVYAPSKKYGFLLSTLQEAQEKWAMIPTDTDILITHDPPHGILDFTTKQRHGGCPTLKKTVLERVKPLYHIFGHIHEAYGQQKIGRTTFMNAASVTKQKEINIHIPFEINLPFKK